MLGEDLIEEVLYAINTCTIPNGWNDTTIVLIPKINNPKKVTQFRPISLCNVVYKVIAKMVATRLKVFLPDIISPTQSAFVPRRLITHNILVAYECFHTIKNKREGKDGLCAMKLDMHKAYGRVEWTFLKEMMLRLGFRQQWVNFIMQCVSSVKCRVRINGEESMSLKPTRGLRQGDPLSPYLFLLCTEGLSVLLTRAEETGNISGVKVCRDAQPITSLLFADDS
uniref:Reverse transcriptase domain-containing protein n=1 Tax=Hordeum vulgare subsp. vulgare TaxID=112509 RepID=A0A8I6WS32_HORVV